MARPATYDHLRSKKRLEKRVTICLDPEIAEALSDAQEALAAVELAPPPENATKGQKEAFEASRAGAADDVERLKAEAGDQLVTCQFRSIGRKRYDALVREHPASDEENAEHEEEHGAKAPYSFEGMLPALVAASCYDPELTEEQWATILGDWNAAEIIELWVAALEVNTQRRVVDLGKDYG